MVSCTSSPRVLQGWDALPDKGQTDNDAVANDNNALPWRQRRQGSQHQTDDWCDPGFQWHHVLVVPGSYNAVPSKGQTDTDAVANDNNALPWRQRLQGCQHQTDDWCDPVLQQCSDQEVHQPSQLSVSAQCQQYYLQSTNVNYMLMAKWYKLYSARKWHLWPIKTLIGYVAYLLTKHTQVC